MSIKSLAVFYKDRVSVEMFTRFLRSRVVPKSIDVKLIGYSMYNSEDIVENYITGVSDSLSSGGFPLLLVKCGNIVSELNPSVKKAINATEAAIHLRTNQINSPIVLKSCEGLPEILEMWERDLSELSSM